MKYDLTYTKDEQTKRQADIEINDRWIERETNRSTGRHIYTLRNT